MDKSQTYMVQNQEKLTTPEYWDQVMVATKIPRIYNRQQYNVYRFCQLFDKFFNNPELKTLCEVGCGASAWLPFFSKTYQLQCSGLDYSQTGCELARRNLQSYGLPHQDCIYCQDLFALSENLLPQSDVVFSYGVVEHFDDPAFVIRQMKHLQRKHGIIITVVPNFNGFNLLRNIFVRYLQDTRQAISKENLQNMHEINGYKTLFCSYHGTLFLDVIPWAKTRLPILRHPFIAKNFCRAVSAANYLLSSILRLTRANFESRFTSPYVVYIGELQ